MLNCRIRERGRAGRPGTVRRPYAGSGPSATEVHPAGPPDGG